MGTDGNGRILEKKKAKEPFLRREKANEGKSKKKKKQVDVRGWEWLV